MVSLISGLYLTLFTYTAAVTEAPADSVKWTLSHVSVHDGTTAHASPYTPGEIEPSWKAVRDGGAFWDLEWTTSAAPWPIPEVWHQIRLFLPFRKAATG